MSLTSTPDALPVRPRLHRSYYAVAVPQSDDVLLYREGRGVRLKPVGGSELLRHLLETVDGSRTVDEIVARLARFDSQLVVASLQSLQRRGLLEEGDESSTESVNATGGAVQTLLSNVAPQDVSQAWENLAQASVVVVGTGSVSSALLHMLPECGAGRIYGLPSSAVTRPSVLVEDTVAVPDAQDPDVPARRAPLSVEARGGLADASLVIVASDHPDPDLLEAVNDVCVDHSVVLLPVVLAGYEGRLGPACIPGQTACVVCASLRAKSNLSRYQEYLLYEDVMRRRPGERPFGRLPHFPAVLAGMAATEAFALITNAYPATTLGRVVVMDLLTSESESHDVLRVPRCPACGRLARRAKGSRPSQRLTWAPGVGDVAD